MAKSKEEKKSQACWKAVFEMIEQGGYTMSGLDRQQIEKLIEMMRGPRFQYRDSPDRMLVAEMLKQVSPRTALVLYTLAWFKDHGDSGSPTSREIAINDAMQYTFATLKPSPVLAKAWYHRSSFQMWYDDDTIGNCLIQPKILNP